MQAVKGYYSNGWFKPIDDVELPNQIEAVLVFEETTAKLLSADEIKNNISESEKLASIKWLNQIKKSLALSRDEDLSGFPEQGTMKVSYDDWLE